LVERKKKEFLGAGGIIDEVKEPKVEGGYITFGEFIEATGPGKKPRIILYGGHSEGTLAEELIHWQRSLRGDPQHPPYTSPGYRTTWGDDIIQVMKAWGFERD
jgi:hypothetical protein